MDNKNEVIPASLHKSESPVQAEVIIKTELWSALVLHKSYLLAVAAPLFYLAGFLVLNAHLSKFGIAEYEIVSTRYVLAAGNFALFLFCYGLFAAKSVTSIHEWITSTSQRVLNGKPKNSPWILVVILRSMTLPLFSICFAAALYSSIAIHQAKVDFFYVAIGVFFAVSYMLETSNLSAKYPRAIELVELCIDLLAVIVFFTMNSGEVLKVFWIYLGLSAYINYVLDLASRRKRSSFLYVFIVLNTVFSILSLALFYGSAQYEKVSHKVGGGMPFAVEIALQSGARGTLPAMFAKQGETIKTMLVYQTEKFVYLDYEGHTLRLRNDDVLLLDIDRTRSDQITAIMRPSLAGH